MAPSPRNPLLGPASYANRPPTEEVGTSAPRAGIESWTAFLDEAETTPDLSFPRSIETYHTMRTDSQVDALHHGTVSPIKEFRWSIDPNGAPATLVENFAADLGLPVKGEEDQPVPRARNEFDWDAFLTDALLSPLYGFFDFEVVGSIVEAKDFRLDKLGPRHPRLTEAFEEDHAGRLVAIRQRVAGPKTGGLGMAEPIPANRLVRFVWRAEAGSHIGRSMLRSMFREWSVKDRTIRIAAINLQRAGGVPVVEGAQGMSDPQIADLAKLARQFKVSEGGGGAIPFGTKLQLVGGSVPDAISLLRYCDEAMARVWMLMLLQLGMTETGSRALGAEFAIYAARAQRSFAKWVAASVNGLGDRYVEWNDPFQTHAPRISFETARPDGLSLADLVALVEAGIVKMDPELEEWVRSEGGLPEASEAEEEGEAEPQQGTSPVDEGEGQPPGAKVPSTKRDPTVNAPTFARGGATAHPLGVAREYGGVRASLTLPPRELRRPPSANEIRAAVDFRGLDAAHRDTTVALQQAWLKDVLPTQIRAMGDQIRGMPALSKATVAGVAAPTLGIDLLDKHLQDAAVSGASAVKREMRAQGRPASHVDLVPDTHAALAPRVADQAEALAKLNANAVALAAQRKASQLVSEGGRSKEEVARAMEDHLKEQKHVWEREQLRGAVTMAQNGGRVAAFESQPDAPEATYEASELLDENTCDPCAAIDGTVFESLEEAEEAYAGGGYVDCEGGPNCRGTLVAVYPEQNPESGEGPLAEPAEPYTQPEPSEGAPTPEMIEPSEPPLDPFEATILEGFDANTAKENLEVLSPGGLPVDTESAFGNAAVDEAAHEKRAIEAEKHVVSAHEVVPVMEKVNKINVDHAISREVIDKAGPERSAAGKEPLKGARLPDGRIAILRENTAEAMAQILAGKLELAVEVVAEWEAKVAEEAPTLRTDLPLEVAQALVDVGTASSAEAEPLIKLGRSVQAEATRRHEQALEEFAPKARALEDQMNAVTEQTDKLTDEMLAATRRGDSEEHGRLLAERFKLDTKFDELLEARSASPEWHDSLQAMLEEVRQMGGDLDYAGRPGAKREVATKVTSRFPRDWIDHSNRAGKVRLEANKKRSHYHTEYRRVLGPDGRPRRQVGEGTIRLTNREWSSGRAGGVGDHEFMHRFQQTVPNLMRIEREWWEKRTAGEAARRLNTIEPRAGYRADEVTKPDKFADPYTGKLYENMEFEVTPDGVFRVPTSGAGHPGEVLTIGVQEAFGKVAPEDGEHAALVVGALAAL